MHTTVAVRNESESERRDRFGDWYDRYVRYKGEDPSVVTVHCVYQRYGGPEEGGWHYQEGQPISNHCVFSREQAIEKLLWLHTHYETEDQYWGEEYDINLASSYAKAYPEHKPHYE